MAEEIPPSPGPDTHLPPSQSKDPIEVNLLQDIGGEPSSLSRFSEKLTEPFRKEMTARRIGTMLIVIFGLTAGLIIIEGFHIISSVRDHPEIAKPLVIDAIIPFLEKVATFLTTVFSPLLAFILGYYFGQKQTDSNTKA
jgi:hypothetical protein